MIKGNQDMDRKYTIQEIRDMLCEFFDKRNAYKYLEEAQGHETVQKFLESIQEQDKMEEQ